MLITGATSGLGRALALAYAAPGRALILHGRAADRLDAVSRQCTAMGSRVESKALDLRDGSLLDAWLAELSQHDPVDLAIINAGIIDSQNRGSTTAMPGADWREIMDVNVRAAIGCASAVIGAMRRRGSGQIALMSSLLAYCALPAAPAYSASKAALKAYGEALRPTLAREGIRVNVILPGFIDTAMSDQLPLYRPFMLSPDDAARRIVRGLARNQARVSFPLPLVLAARGLSLLPVSAAQRLMVLVTRRD